MNKYEVLDRLSNYQYIYNCPVFITGGNILKETESNDIYINMKFRNISAETVKAVIISIDCFDIEGDVLAPVNKFIYQDFEITPGGFLGEEKVIKCPDQNTRICKIKIKKVIFFNKGIWENSDNVETISLGLQTRITDWSLIKLKDVLYGELRALNYSKSNAIYIPSRFVSGWVCTCGMINFDDKDCSCGMTYNNAFKIFDEKYLEEKFEEYKNEERRQKQALEDAARRRAVLAQREREERRKVEEVRRRLQREEDERNQNESRKDRITFGVIILSLLIVISVICIVKDKGNSEYTIYDSNNASYTQNISGSNEDLSQNDSLYEYYDMLSEEWTGSNRCHELGNFKFYFDNNKIYFINTDPDDNPGTADGYKWYYYDINTKEYKALFGDDEEPFLPDSYAFVRILSSWYYDNAFYVEYKASSYNINDSYNYVSLIKMDNSGNILNRVVFDKSSSMDIIKVLDGKIIIERYNSGDYDSMKYEVYSSDLKRIATFGLPLKSLDHGLTQSTYVSDFFEFDGNIYGDADGTLYKMDMDNALWINANISAQPSSNFGKYCLSSDDKCIFDVETGEKIYEGYVPPAYHYNCFGNTYFGGNCNYELINGSWFKVQYPNGMDPDFSQYEPMGSESARYQESIVQLNDNYYIFKDRYGIFLRTYDKGESQEDTIMLF